MDYTKDARDGEYFLDKEMLQDMHRYPVALDFNIGIPADHGDLHIKVASNEPPQGGVLSGNELSGGATPGE